VQQFPADLLLLGSAESHGMCFVETSNIDGETNLKPKQAIPETAYVVASLSFHILLFILFILVYKKELLMQSQKSDVLLNFAICC
jgi:magnesium-transporting ATPase (P-type)